MTEVHPQEALQATTEADRHQEDQDSAAEAATAEEVPAAVAAADTAEAALAVQEDNFHTLTHLT